MFASDEELLTETTVETFGHMRIHADVQMSIQRRIFKCMCNNRASVESLKLWPTYTKFILNSSYENADALLMVIVVTIMTTTVYIFFLFLLTRLLMICEIVCNGTNRGIVVHLLCQTVISVSWPYLNA